jgi:hypothetical protein
MLVFKHMPLIEHGRIPVCGSMTSTNIQKLYRRNLMKRFGMRCIALAVYLSALCASAKEVDISEFERDIDGPRTQILVLGSPHLSGMPDSFQAEQLEPVLERLMRFKPAVITIEKVSGESCDQLQRYAAIYPGVANVYCRDIDADKKATGLDVPAALAEVEKTLATWPEQPTPAQRRRLIALFAAANDHASMVVQWLQLPAAERRAGDTLAAEVVVKIEKIAKLKNESIMLAAVLAARLGLQRVYAVDDHTADSINAKGGQPMEDAVKAIWAQSTDTPLIAKLNALENANDMLATYRFYNSPEAQRAFIAVDFGAALKHQSAQRYGRQYVAWWETRNLRMVANIRAAIGNQPGVRVLSLVGASHKPYFDAYLGLMHDIDVEDTEAWLR